MIDESLEESFLTCLKSNLLIRLAFFDYLLALFSWLGSYSFGSKLSICIVLDTVEKFIDSI